MYYIHSFVECFIDLASSVCSVDVHFVRVEPSPGCLSITGYDTRWLLKAVFLGSKGRGRTGDEVLRPSRYFLNEPFNSLLVGTRLWQDESKPSADHSPT